MHAYHTASYNLLVSKNLKNFPLSIINSKKKKNYAGIQLGVQQIQLVE